MIEARGSESRSALGEYSKFPTLEFQTPNQKFQIPRNPKRRISKIRASGLKTILKGLKSSSPMVAESARLPWVTHTKTFANPERVEIIQLSVARNELRWV